MSIMQMSFNNTPAMKRTSTCSRCKKPILKYAQDLGKVAEQWTVKLPKDFTKQAEAYQAELDEAIKALGK